MHVAHAEPRHVELDEDLAGTGLRDGDILDFELEVGAFVDLPRSISEGQISTDQLQSCCDSWMVGEDYHNAGFTRLWYLEAGLLGSAAQLPSLA